MCSNDGEMKARGIVCDSFECVPLICKRRDNTRRATRWEKIALVCLTPEGISCFSTLPATVASFLTWKWRFQNSQFLVHWLVTGRMTPTLPPAAPPPPATDTPPHGDLQWRIWLSVLFWEHICALPRSPPPLRLLCARLAWSLLLLWPYGEQCACLLQPGKRCRAGVRIKCCYEMRHVFFLGGRALGRQPKWNEFHVGWPGWRCP